MIVGLDSTGCVVSDFIEVLSVTLGWPLVSYLSVEPLDAGILLWIAWLTPTPFHSGGRLQSDLKCLIVLTVVATCHLLPSLLQLSSC